MLTNSGFYLRKKKITNKLVFKTQKITNTFVESYLSCYFVESKKLIMQIVLE